MKIAICGEGWVNRVGSTAIGIFHIVQGDGVCNTQNKCQGSCSRAQINLHLLGQLIKNKT